MWYKKAQQGIMNLDKRLVPGAEQAIASWLQDMTTLLPSKPGEAEGRYFEFENVEIPPYLKQYISKIDHNVPDGALGSYDPHTKTLKLPLRVPRNQYNNLLSTVLHEIRHSVDPRFSNPKLLSKYNEQFYKPDTIKKKMFESFMMTGSFPSYDDVINKMIADVGLDPSFKSTIQKSWPQEAYSSALNSIVKQKDLYLNNPIELPSQLGDVRNLLNKNVLDSVKQKYYPQSTPEQWKEYLKNSLAKPGSQEFENLSNQIQEVSGNQGNTISTVVKGTKDPKWQRQYLNQVSNAVNQYQVPENAFKNFSGAVNQYQAPNKAVNQVSNAVGQVPNKAVNQVTNALDNLQIPSNAITNFVKKTLT